MQLQINYDIDKKTEFYLQLQFKLYSNNSITINVDPNMIRYYLRLDVCSFRKRTPSKKCSVKGFVEMLY